uniref:RNA recognition motif (A.k.a. RRM, RBD, or RNP domain)/RNA recognition motif. (A.k.a. RRM, RBD, or RNP domain), putative n=1 Tax=Theileria annulata TaxID=5874 RepID=A0A3B0MY29_THEAN
MSSEPYGDKSRLIIKNIPNSLDNKSLDKLITKKCKDLGVTKSDIRLLTKEKKVNNELKRISRGICYVGFISENDATKFLNHYNNSYFNSCKVTIEYSKRANTNSNNSVNGINGITNGINGIKCGRVGEYGREDEDVKVITEVKPVKAGISSKRVHITFNNSDSDDESQIADNEPDADPAHTIEEDSSGIGSKTENFSTDSSNIDMNRVVIFNLPYNVTEEMIRKLVKPFGKVEQIHIPLNKRNISEITTGNNVSESAITRGMCFVTFCFESDALKFIEEKNNSIFSGRIITISHAKSNNLKFFQKYIPKGKKYRNKDTDETSYSEFKAKKKRSEIENRTIWNILHIDINSAIKSIASDLRISPEEILKGEQAGVNAAISESFILNKVKKWLSDQGINSEVTNYNEEDLYEDVLLIKNLPHDTEDRELIRLFSSCGKIIKFTTSPFKLLGLVQFSSKTESEKAFRTLSYKMFQNLPLYLQKVPKSLLPNINTVNSDHTDDSINELNDKVDDTDTDDQHDDKMESDDRIENRIGHVSVYVSNIDGNVSEEEFEKHFSNLKGFVISKIIKPHGSKLEEKGGVRYGFIEFDNVNNAKEAIKRLCGTVIGSKIITLELSKNKQTISKYDRNKEEGPKEENDVIIVKNLPFQATKKELLELFKYYANVKTVRIPKSAGNTHRGFGFVVFMSKNDAKLAMENLKNVHLYGRRLVLQYVENSNQ